jgi:hypothetical protein
MEAYPLQWPPQWPRTKYPQQAQFKVGMGEAVSDLYDELERLGATNIIVSSNMQVRLDGRPYAKQNRMSDEGVACYFTYNGAQQCIPCDKWTTVKDNVRAIGLTVAALRGLERWGAKEMVNAAFQGFKALPTGTPQKQWWEILELDGPTDDTVEIQRAYKQIIKKAHPDAGGTDHWFQQVQAAYKQGMDQ